MPTHKDNFPWISYYGKYKFFEQKIREHDNVKRFESVDPSLYYIELTDSRLIKTFICECYSFDVAEYMEVYEELGDIDAVVISSNWCGYSLEVKRYCMTKKVGVYDIRGYMAAINNENYWEYLTEYEKKEFKEKGWC